ncbi:cobalamin biosynthesis protein [Succinimonas amylolytica]|uniref:cobalamin biosynthesis protein n=1 Tax=Succinimonas amylolytica TaxID=83769 RepID=UPI00037FD8EC|nr:cobalamin biosynthesis protein [Succinimonas amylolytica]
MITEIFGTEITPLPLDTRTGFLFLALLIEWFMPFPFFVRLNRLVPGLAALGRRVNRQGSSTGQQKLAGVLLPLLILLPVFAFIIAFKEILNGVDYAHGIIDFFLLLLILESRPERAMVKAVARNINSGRKKEAREILGRFTLRVTSRLSPMGMYKAAAESAALRLINSFYVPAFAYLVLGIYGALAVKLIIVMSMAFNLKLPVNQYFGRLCYFAEQLCFLLPALWLIPFIIMLPGGAPADPRALAAAIQSWPSKTTAMALALLASKENIRLGGPRYYMLGLYRFPEIGGTEEPTEKTVKDMIGDTGKAVWFALMTLIIAGIGYEYYAFYH